MSEEEDEDLMGTMDIIDSSAKSGFDRSSSADTHSSKELLSQLVMAIDKFKYPHSAMCIDFKQESWPVTVESCRCCEREKNLRRAIKEAKDHLGIIS